MQTEHTGDSWINDVDNDQIPQMDKTPPKDQHETDADNLRLGEEFLSHIPSFKLVIQSHVLKDIWHIFDMITISKSHGLRSEFSRTLCDAVFLINKEDSQQVDGRLKSEGSSFEEKLKYNPKYLWCLV